MFEIHKCSLTFNDIFIPGQVAVDHTIADWCTNEPGNVLSVGHFNDDNNADLLCDSTNDGKVKKGLVSLHPKMDPFLSEDIFTLTALL